MKNVKKLFLITICLLSITSVPVQALLGTTPQATEGVFKRVLNGVGNNTGWVAFAVTAAYLYKDAVKDDWYNINDDWERTEITIKGLSTIAVGSIVSCYLLRWIGSKL